MQKKKNQKKQKRDSDDMKRIDSFNWNYLTREKKSAESFFLLYPFFSRKIFISLFRFLIQMSRKSQKMISHMQGNRFCHVKNFYSYLLKFFSRKKKFSLRNSMKIRREDFALLRFPLYAIKKKKSKRKGKVWREKKEISFGLLKRFLKTLKWLLRPLHSFILYNSQTL